MLQVWLIITGWFGLTTEAYESITIIIIEVTLYEASSIATRVVNYYRVIGFDRVHLHYWSIITACSSLTRKPALIQVVNYNRLEYIHIGARVSLKIHLCTIIMFPYISVAMEFIMSLTRANILKWLCMAQTFFRNGYVWHNDLHAEAHRWTGWPGRTSCISEGIVWPVWPDGWITLHSW